MIPLLELKALNAPFQQAIEEAVLRVARSGRYILGPEVERFEQEWAAYCGTKHCVGTANALEALQLILLGMEIGPGDEVLVPSNTYIATWLSVTHAGARPVPVEPDPFTHNIDPRRIEDAITPRTRAIIVVHLYGRPADMGPIRAVADYYRLPVIEDAAQAHGAVYDGARAGALGHAAAFSFYPSKNLGSMGDAGAITTNDAGLAASCRRMRNYGGVGRVDHQIIGINSRLDEMQAAILTAKLPFLAQMNQGRQNRANVLSNGLRDSGLVLPVGCAGHVYHQFVVRVRGHVRDYVHQRLAVLGLDTHVHYPVPPHLEGAYEHLHIRQGMLPIAEMLAQEVLSLPIGNINAMGRMGRLVSQVVLDMQREGALND